MIRPLGDRVLVREDKAEATIAGGVLLPVSVQSKPNRGVVVAVGTNEMVVSVNDNVIFGQYTGTELSVDGEIFLLMREADIFAIV